MPCLRCAFALADAGIERTYNFKQEDILKHVEVGAAQKVFDLGLPDLGPYKVRQSRGADGVAREGCGHVGWGCSAGEEGSQCGATCHPER